MKQESEEKKTLMELGPEEKISKAVRFIKSLSVSQNLFLAYSGGKDSVVLNYLAKESGVKIRMVHNVTTIDPPGTISFCLKNGAELKRNRRSFLDIVEAKGLPTMFRRFCCKELKEQYIDSRGLYGIRRAESVRRSKCYGSFEDIYYYSKKIYTERFFPILYFTDSDVEYVINSRHLECHPLYYDKGGVFHVERRLGCIGCPLQGDRGVSDYKNYPEFLKLVMQRLVKYHVNHGRNEKDAYLNAVYNLFYSNHGFQKYQCRFCGFFEEDPKEFLSSYFNIHL